MPELAERAEEFDEVRFRALLDLAGPSTARELTLRLDKDLTGVASALSGAANGADAQVLRAQSHILLAIAGTIGANRLYALSLHLNHIARAAEFGLVAEVLREIMVLLHRLIDLVRATHRRLVSQTRAGQP